MCHDGGAMQSLLFLRSPGWKFYGSDEWFRMQGTGFKVWGAGALKRIGLCVKDSTRNPKS